MATKNYVLDTNVLLHDPRSMYAFSDNNVIIPIYVIEEIDNFKKDLSELGRNARQVARQLDSHRSVAAGGLSEEVTLENGGTIRVAIAKSADTPAARKNTNMDGLILEVALEVRDGSPDLPTILVTKDVNLRIRGDALGIQTVDFEPEAISIEELYDGATVLEVEGSIIDGLYKDGSVRVEEELSANEYILLQDKEDQNHTALGRYELMESAIVPLKKIQNVWGIRPRNKEQHYGLDALLNDEIKLVTLVGKAGTGKTLLALAAGLHKVTEERIFSKLLVSRPIFPLGRDIGYLPGDIEEKLNPWMQPIYDNLELLLGNSAEEQGQKKSEGQNYQQLIEMGLVQVEPLTYIRGRSLPNVFMIIDEAQNLTPHEVKTIVTRAGEGTKIVLTGDPYQIDNPYVDSSNNGLTTVAERFKAEAIAAHATLTKGERSELAELATKIL